MNTPITKERAQECEDIVAKHRHEMSVYISDFLNGLQEQNGEESDLVVSACLCDVTEWLMALCFTKANVSSVFHKDARLGRLICNALELAKQMESQASTAEIQKMN